MRILIVNAAARISGGAEKVALHSAVQLANRGHQVRLIAANGPIGEEFMGIPNLEIKVLDSEPVREGRNLIERAKMVWPKRVSEALRQEFSQAKENPETVVHFHSGYLELGIPGFRALAHSGLPTVYTHHDYAWACPLMGFYNYTTQRSCPLVGGSIGCLTTDCTNRYLEKLVRYGRHFGTHQSSGIGSRVDHHIFVSETSESKLAPYLPQGAESTVVLNATEVERSPRISATDNSELIFLGRLTVEKDPLTFAETTRSVNMSAKIVGDGPLRSCLEKAGFASQLTGWKSADEVASLVAGSRALVQTSRCMETASLVVLEAAALGVPSVVPGDTAAAEFVHHECTGLIYDRAAESSLAQNLSRLKDTAYANFMGTEAYRQFWQNPPTWNRHLDQLEEIYRRVLERV